MDFLWRLNSPNYAHWQVSPFLRDRQTTTDLTTNFLQESDKLVYGPLVLLAPEWRVVKRALYRWCRHWSPSHAGTRAWCRLRTPGWKFHWSLRSGSRRRSWAHNLWEELCWPKGKTPHSRKRTGGLAPNRSTWKMKWKIRRMKWQMGETKWRVRREGRREIKHTGAWQMDGMTRTNTSSQCRVRHYHECGQTRQNVTYTPQ